jgi:hypothetical protein
MIGAMPVMPGMLAFTVPADATISVVETVEYSDNAEGSQQKAAYNPQQQQRMNYIPPPNRATSKQFLQTLKGLAYSLHTI